VFRVRSWLGRAIAYEPVPPRTVEETVEGSSPGSSPCWTSPSVKWRIAASVARMNSMEFG
jgi:hypothetical protein